MELGDIVALAGFIAGALAVPAAWLAYRKTRQDRKTEEFRRHFAEIQSGQVELGRAAWMHSHPDWKSREFPLPVKPGWIPEHPYELGEIALDWNEPQASHALAERTWREARAVVAPLRLGADAGYSDALTSKGGMSHLFNGRIYRLLDLDFSGTRKRAAVTEGRYYDYLDTSEVLIYETRLVARNNQLRALHGTYRKRLADPFDFRRRVVCLGISTLTFRVTADRVGFYVHLRERAKVAKDASFLSAIPSGEFTPANATLESLRTDCDLWRNIMREYAEEFLGDDDALGASGQPVNYATDSPYQELDRARSAGSLRVKVLAVGLDPLSWKPEILTTCIIDGAVFDDVFAKLVHTNAEGDLHVGINAHGFTFDEATVRMYVAASDSAPSLRGALSLAWQHRDELGLTRLTDG